MRVLPLRSFRFEKPDSYATAAVAASAVTGILVALAIIASAFVPAKQMPLVLAAALVPFVIMISGSVRRVMLATILLDIPLQISMTVGFDQKWANIGTLTGWEFSLTTIALAVLYATWFVDLMTQRAPARALGRAGNTLSRRGLSDVKNEIAPLGAYVAFAGVSVLWARNTTFSLYEFFTLAQVFLLFVYVVRRVRTQDEVIFIVTMLVVGMILEGLIFGVLRVTNREFQFGPLRTRIDTGGEGTRIGGTIGSPITAAGYLALVISIAFSMLLAPVPPGVKLIAILGFALGGMALGLTLSRGGWITVTLALSIIIIAATYRRWVSPVVPALGVLVAVAVFFVFQSAIVNRFTGDDGGSAAARAPLMRLAWAIIRDHPVLGVGLNNFGSVMRAYLTPDFQKNWIFTVHNHWLLTWAETGIGGVAAFVVFLAATLWRGWQAFRINAPVLAPLAVGMTAGIASQLSHMTVDVFHSRPQVEILWLVCALIVVVLRLCRQWRSEGHTGAPSGTRSARPTGGVA